MRREVLPHAPSPTMTSFLRREVVERVERRAMVRRGLVDDGDESGKYEGAGDGVDCNEVDICWYDM